MARQAATPKKTTKTAKKTSLAAARTGRVSKVEKVEKPTRERTITTSRTAAATANGRTGASFGDRFNRDVSPQALVAEAVGTFVLAAATLGALAALTPLYAGLTLVVLFVAIGSISGAHLNPAVTLGLWSARLAPGLAVPFYWLAQMLGGLGAFLITSAFSGNGVTLNLGKFFSSFDWSVFAIETIGAIILLFGITAALSRFGLSLAGRATGYGLSLLVALAVSNSFYTTLVNGIDRASIQSVADVPRALRLENAQLNPAVAIGAKEKSDAQLQGSTESGANNTASRLTVETVVGPLLGGIIGANLYRLLARREERS